jgi:hypothetical protein
MSRTQPDTRQRGKDFENLVRATLVGAGYRVSSEELLNFKKVDLIARHSRWGREWITIVECKGYSKPVGKGELVKIWIDHEPLYQTGAAHDILVVAKSGFTPQAKAYIRARRGLIGQSFDELLDSIMDFGRYLLAMVDGYESSPDGIEHYYQKPKLDNGEDLESVVVEWMKEEAKPMSGRLPKSRPIAILGAYGIGKSSFATHLSASLARRALKDGNCRIPVLVRLGDIGGEQSLEGLMGKHFTTHHAVSGYSFDAFMLLNRRGRFVTILDGFDEMKQMLNWREFRYNLRQLNRLHDGNSRLILLGRPTAFESDEEHQEALHGRGHRDEKPGWPDYSELSIQQFGPRQVRKFLKDYLKYRESPIASNPDDLRFLWEQVRSIHLRDISRRPVQLRMLAEILPDYPGDVASLTVARVYELFISRLIDEVIRREEDKQGRLAFSKYQRREFLRDVAFWLWTREGPLVTTHDLPKDIVEKYAKGYENLERARRDLISGSPLDRRLGDRIRFPHSSFQEYLVAEELWVRFKSRETNLEAIDDLMNDEVADFFGRQMRPLEAGRVLGTLPDLRGPLHWRTARALFLDTPLSQILRDDFDAKEGARKAQAPSPWELLGLVIDSGLRPTRARGTFRLDDLLGFCSQLGQASLLSLFGCLVALHATPTRRLHRIAGDTLVQLVNDGTTELTDVGGDGLVDRLSETVAFNRDGSGHLGLIADGSRPEADRGRTPGTADNLEVHWLSDQAVTIARRLAFSRDGSDCDVQALRPVFGARLPDYAFVKEWLTTSPRGYDTVASDVGLAPFLNGTKGQFKPLRDLCSAISRGVDQAIDLHHWSGGRVTLFQPD